MRTPVRRPSTHASPAGGNPWGCSIGWTSCEEEGGRRRKKGEEGRKKGEEGGERVMMKERNEDKG